MASKQLLVTVPSTPTHIWPVYCHRERGRVKQHRLAYAFNISGLIPHQRLIKDFPEILAFHRQLGKFGGEQVEAKIAERRLETAKELGAFACSG